MCVYIYICIYIHIHINDIYIYIYAQPILNVVWEGDIFWRQSVWDAIQSVQAVQAHAFWHRQYELSTFTPFWEMLWVRYIWPGDMRTCAQRARGMSAHTRKGHVRVPRWAGARAQGGVAHGPVRTIIGNPSDSQAVRASVTGRPALLSQSGEPVARPGPLTAAPLTAARLQHQLDNEIHQTKLN